VRALVAGGGGHIGSHLCDALLAQGHQVTCVDNFSTAPRSNLRALEGREGFSVISADVSQPLESAPEVDWVFHLASPASPPEYLRRPLETLAVNSQGTWNLLDLAVSQGARFLLASTSEVYGDPEVHPQVETYWGNVNPNGPRSCYDESKRFAEALTAAFVRRGVVDARIARIFNTYGPNSRPRDGRMVPNFISQALSGEKLTIYGKGNQTRSLCYVRDTVRGLLLLMDIEEASGVVVNVGNPEEHTVEEYAELISRLCGVEHEISYLPLPEDDPVRRRPDISKARELLGWEPEWSLADGLEATITWFRSILEVSGRSLEQPSPA